MKGLLFGTPSRSGEIGRELVKAAKSDATATYSLSGRLYKSDSGWIMLSVPNALVRGAFDALDEPGVEMPPRFNAHISVIRPEELEEIGGANKITERGHTFKYQLGKVKTTTPAGWKGMSKVWFIEVKSPALEKLRKSYGLSPRPKNNEFAFHITVAVRRKKVLQRGEVSKVALLLLKAAKKKHEQPAGYVKETEEIKARREIEGAKPHEFEVAEWTHPNGHPRCKICGDEERESGQCGGYKVATFLGIPDKSQQGDLGKLQVGQLLDLVIQRHRAQRAGDHYDVRFGNPQLGLFSWATRKGLPEPGGRHALFRQPLHCFPPNVTVLTEEGWLSIGDIVKQRRCLRVLSAANDGTLEWKPILNFWQRDCDESLISLRMAGGFHRHRGITCTLGHEIYCGDRRRAAGEIKPGDHVRVRSPYPSDDQWQIILGGLLGDASFDTDGTHRFGHSEKQSSYYWWKVQMLYPFVRHASTRQRSDSFGKRPFLQTGGVSGYTPFVEVARSNYVHRQGKRVKRVTAALLERIGPLALAIWYQDDGSKLVHGNRLLGCSFATHDFDTKSVELLIAWLRGVWGFTAVFAVPRPGRAGSREIRMACEDTLSLWKLIRPYMHPSMAYKAEPPVGFRMRQCRECEAMIMAKGKGRRCRACRICDNCLLQHLQATGCRSEAEYDARYRRTKTGFAPRTYRLRFGSFTAALQTALLPPQTVTTAVELPLVGRSLGLLRCEPEERAVPIRVISSHPINSPNSRYAKVKQLYNLEVADNHNYFVAGGILVGNSHAYGDFQGAIAKGYGAGTVEQHRKGKILVTKVEPDKISFTTADERYPERFVLLKPKKSRDWLLINVTSKEPVPYDKVRYKKIPAEAVESSLAQMQAGDSAQAKIDGASSLITILKDGVDVTSYRTSKTTGRPIVHTERMFHGRPQLKIPPELVNTVLKGELYGERQAPGSDMREGGPDVSGVPILRGQSWVADGRDTAAGDGEVPSAASLSTGRGAGGDASQVARRTIPPQELGGLLNATLGRSIEQQRARRVRLRAMLHNIQRFGDVDVGEEVPYAERRKLIAKVLPFLPEEHFHMPEEATTPEEAQKLWSAVSGGQHPLTQEGIVIHPASGKPMKAKLLEEQDVHITGTFPGKGRLEGTGAGGFTYALEEGGETAGEVGTGLSDELRRDLHASPETYIGRLARVRSQGAFPSGALRAPSLIAMHEDYPDKTASEKQAVPFWQRAAIGQLHRPTRFSGGLVANLLQNLRQAWQRGQSMVQAQDTARDMTTAGNLQAALQRTRNFLEQGDTVVTDPVDRALFRPLTQF